MPSVDLIARGLAGTDADLGLGIPQPPQYRVWLRDDQYNIVDELDNWTGLELVLRTNGIGTWHLEIANDSRSVASVILQRASGIVVRRDNVTIFSGSVTTLTKTFRTITASGEDDMALLRALALPDPLTSPPYPDAYNVITSQASDVLLNLVNNNIGPAARADRKIAALTLSADPHLGATITARAGFQPLIALLADLASQPATGGLVFSILQSDTVANKLEFKVRAPVDRSADCKFSVELGTAQDYEDTLQAPTANAPYVLLGDGLAGTRTILEDVDATSVAEWGRRFETIIDRRDVTDLGEGNQSLAEAMAQTSSSRKVTVTPIDVPSLQYGRDWDLGDLVTFAADGLTFVDLIREVHVSWDPARGPIVTPLIGEQGATNDDPLDQMVGTIQARLSNVERNWLVPDDSVTQAMLHPYMKWQIGDVRLTARTAAQAGWLLCFGQAVSRTAYVSLFGAIGTTFGPGDGSTTFNVPDLRGRFPAGAGGSYALGQTGGAASASGPPHTHPGSHSHGLASHTHTGAPHTHPGSHSHGLASHTHGLNSHTHDVDINHTHGAFTTGGENTFAATFSTYPTATTNISHNHQVTISALGATTKTSGGPNTGNTVGPSPGSSDPDTNVFAASYSGATGVPSPSGSDTDSNVFAASYTGTIATVSPFVAVNYEIFAGV